MFIFDNNNDSHFFVNNSLIIFHLNIISVNKNFDELCVILVSLTVNFEAIILTENWLFYDSDGSLMTVIYLIIVK